MRVSVRHTIDKFNIIGLYISIRDPHRKTTIKSKCSTRCRLWQTGPAHATDVSEWQHETVFTVATRTPSISLSASRSCVQLGVSVGEGRGPGVDFWGAIAAGTLPTWCSPASILSCRGCDPGSNPRRRRCKGCHRGRHHPTGAFTLLVPVMLGPEGSATCMIRCGIPGRFGGRSTLSARREI